MKFMKLGTKPDQFQSNGENIRQVVTDVATDMVVVVGDIKFYLHKFSLLSKSPCLQHLAATSGDEISIPRIPGGPRAFEICAKFCYGMAVTLHAYNMVPARAAAEYLEMNGPGNLAHKIDVFLSSTLLRTWKDSIILLHASKSYLPWSEELKIVTHCLDSIASRASVDPSTVRWSYTHNRKNLPSENGAIPIDWWVEDLCGLPLDLYKRVITAIQAKGRISGDIVGESLRAYASRRLRAFQSGGGGPMLLPKHRCLVETVTRLLPEERSSVPCGFLLELLHAAFVLGCEERVTGMLTGIIALQLDEATVSDLVAVCDVDAVQGLVERFVMAECGSDGSKTRVARLVEGYLAEAARDPALPLSRFIDLADMVSGFPRPTHDGIYRAIDMYLKQHPGMNKDDKTKICRLMDCRRLSPEACAHVVQNERLPLRVVVQVLFFFEQARATARALLPRASSKSKDTSLNSDDSNGEKKVISRLWSKERVNSSSDTSESHASTSE